ncbi:MAG: TetR/AcrR family transcriptional regulator, partial [Herpetosiphonaceae bacterium]|nr:TetR/AcrR family transcriptional regulator [Herpetosiphonaceae bacterium]
MSLPEQRKGVGRPRSASSQQAILDATLLLVAEEGIQGTHIEAIATRAGVGKTTIYRRWPSKEAVILDALSELHGQIKLIDTGNLRTDLLTFLHELLHLMETHPLHERLIFRLLGELKVHPEFAQVLYERVYAPRLGFMTQFVERAEARGE